MRMETNVNHNSTGIVNSTYRTTFSRKKRVSTIILSDPHLTKRPAAFLVIVKYPPPGLYIDVLCLCAYKIFQLIYVSCKLKLPFSLFKLRVTFLEKIAWDVPSTVLVRSLARSSLPNVGDHVRLKHQMDQEENVKKKQSLKSRGGVRVHAD